MFFRVRLRRIQSSARPRKRDDRVRSRGEAGSAGQQPVTKLFTARVTGHAREGARFGNRG